MSNSHDEARHGPIVERLYDPQTQRAARQELVAAGAVEPLLECLKSDNESVVWAAVESLGEMRATEAVGPLIDLLQRGVLMLDVCEALTMITGQYFGTNVGRWRQWLGESSPTPSRPSGATSSRPPGLDAAACVRRAGRLLGVRPDGAGDSYRFKLPLPGGRAQRVAVYFGRKDAKGNEMVIIYSECGPAKPKLYETVLRKNMGIPAGAFAVRDIKGEPHFVLVDTMLAASVSPDVLAKKIEHVAAWADRAEKDLTREDRR